MNDIHDSRDFQGVAGGAGGISSEDPGGPMPGSNGPAGGQADRNGPVLAAAAGADGRVFHLHWERGKKMLDLCTIDPDASCSPSHVFINLLGERELAKEEVEVCVRHAKRLDAEFNRISGHAPARRRDVYSDPECLHRVFPEEPRQARQAARSSDADAGDDGKPLVVRADRVESRRVEWLWPNRIAYAFITIFAGMTGIGKSFVALDVAARKTRGDGWPDHPGMRCTPGNVLIISEDPHDFVLRPRLEAMGADLSRVFFVTWEAMAAYELKDTAMLDRLFEESGGPELIIIDPPTNFLGGIDEHRNSEVRGVLMKIVAWLQGKRVAVVLITQVTKGGREVEAVNRIIGSVAWAATARIAHTFAEGEDGQRLFACPKNNIGPVPATLEYSVVPKGEIAVVEWGGESDKTANDAMNGKPKGRTEKAKDFLIERFGRQREWPSEQLIDEAKRAGISRNAVFEAKKELDIRAQKQETGTWSWMVAPDWTPPFDLSPLADMFAGKTECSQ
jgi:hypothetical protein